MSKKQNNNDDSDQVPCSIDSSIISGISVRNFSNSGSSYFAELACFFIHSFIRFSSLTSRKRRPLRSRHASRFVVFSICAPIARSIDPKPPLPPGIGINK
ncbi:hypothetical protein DERP_007462 [Dermatophagoides pteronyssinus]|uniref:Uncharacterized protein n=1 Tax=Dermatophagoides pteronyssinus TaxID=6956 RepID=A0ABQ8J4G2_DERPT|nr:hypothetical protein DERP_007462 [Dermatophagoides pteronyssinus]